MAKPSIRYNPSISIKENAQKNGCSEDTIRYYIKSHSIDRRAEQAARIITKLRACYEEGKSIAQIAKEAECSVNTVKKYLPFVLTENEPSKIGNKKCQKLTIKQKNEYYATHPSVTRDLLRCEQFSSHILEPCCGGGFMAEEIKKAGYTVEATDIIDRGYGKGNIDFLTADFPSGVYDIITNPPYSDFIPMLNKAMEICLNKVAMLLPLNYLSSQSRYEVFKQYPPKRVYVYVERICIAKNGNFSEYDSCSNMEIYAWYIWERGYKGSTELKWISNDKKAPENPQSTKALILDFDMTLFDTRADNEVRKLKSAKDIDWDEVYSVIPEYRLYDGWREVFAWCKAHQIKIGILSTAKTELINRTLTHFGLECDAVVGWQLYHRKPSAKLVEMILKKLGVKDNEVISIGDSVVDKEMSDNGNVPFVAAIWDSQDAEVLKDEKIIHKPSDILSLLEG